MEITWNTIFRMFMLFFYLFCCENNIYVRNNGVHVIFNGHIMRTTL